MSKLILSMILLSSFFYSIGQNMDQRNISDPDQKTGLSTDNQIEYREVQPRTPIFELFTSSTYLPSLCSGKYFGE